MNVLATDFMQKVRDQNKARAAKHYDAHKEAVNAKRRAAYLAKKQALKKDQAPEPEIIEVINEPEAKVIKPSKIPRVMKKLVVLPEPTPVVKRTKKISKIVTTAPEPAPEPIVAKNPAARKFKIVLPPITPEKALELLTTLDGKAMKNSTAKTRTEDFKRLLEITGNPTNIVKILTKPKETIELINNSLLKNKTKLYSNNTLKNQYQIILTLIDVLGREKLKKEHAIFKEQFEIRKLDSIENNIQKKAEKDFDGNTFATYLATVKETFGELSKMYVIARLYYELPVRDDFMLKIVSNKHPTSKENGVIYMPKKGKAIIHIYQYKTDSKYGNIEKTISLDLTKLIRNYIKDNDLSVGDYLFGDKKLTGFVSGYNKRIGFAGGITNFREMKIAELFADPEISAMKRVKMAEEMKHGVNTQLWYIGKQIKK